MNDDIIAFTCTTIVRSFKYLPNRWTSHRLILHLLLCIFSFVFLFWKLSPLVGNLFFTWYKLHKYTKIHVNAIWVIIAIDKRKLLISLTEQNMCPCASAPSPRAAADPLCHTFTPCVCVCACVCIYSLPCVFACAICELCVHMLFSGFNISLGQPILKSI